MSAESTFDKFSREFRALIGLRSASFWDLAQSREVLKVLQIYLNGTYSALTETNESPDPHLALVIDSINPLHMLLGFTGTALLHLQQQQQGILQAPAEDLTLITMICESLSKAIHLYSSIPAAAQDAEQQIRAARPGDACRNMLARQPSQSNTASATHPCTLFFCSQYMAYRAQH
jgi:hypothetical protein